MVTSRWGIAEPIRPKWQRAESWELQGQEKTKKMRLRWEGRGGKGNREEKRKGHGEEEGQREGQGERGGFSWKPQAPGNGASPGNSNVRVAYPEDVVT